MSCPLTLQIEQSVGEVSIQVVDRGKLPGCADFDFEIQHGSNRAIHRTNTVLFGNGAVILSTVKVGFTAGSELLIRLRVRFQGVEYEEKIIL